MEKRLNLLKNEYQKIKAPDYLVENGWPDIKHKLGNQQSKSTLPNFKRILIYPSFALLAIVVVATSTINAKPGQLLFPAKLKAEEFKNAAGKTLNLDLIKENTEQINNEQETKPAESTKESAVKENKKQPQNNFEDKQNQQPAQEGSVKGKKIDESKNENGSINKGNSQKQKENLIPSQNKKGEIW